MMHDARRKYTAEGWKNGGQAPWEKNGLFRRLHKKRLDGDENACTCGARWPKGEWHPKPKGWAA